jgi:hypothetical protein
MFIICVTKAPVGNPHACQFWDVVLVSEQMPLEAAQVSPRIHKVVLFSRFRGDFLPNRDFLA